MSIQDYSEGVYHSCKTYGFLEDENGDNGLCTLERFIRKYYNILEDIILDPYSTIIYCDLYPSGEFITKFLIGKSYKNVVIYCLNKKPNYNFDGFQTKKFKSRKKLIESLKKDSTIIYIL